MFPNLKKLMVSKPKVSCFLPLKGGGGNSGDLIKCFLIGNHRIACNNGKFRPAGFLKFPPKFPLFLETEFPTFFEEETLFKAVRFSDTLIVL